jgi:hypothetical protein
MTGERRQGGTSAKAMESRRQKTGKTPGAPAASQPQSALQDKLQARLAQHGKVRRRPPVYAEHQAIEISLGTPSAGHAKGIITGVVFQNQVCLYEVLLPESGVRESMVPESKLRARQTTKVRFEFLPLVQELRRKVQYDFYDDPVDEELVPGYYHADPAANQWSITAWNTQSMCFSWMETKAQMHQYANLAAVPAHSSFWHHPSGITRNPIGCGVKGWGLRVWG